MNEPKRYGLARMTVEEIIGEPGDIRAYQLALEVQRLEAENVSMRAVVAAAGDLRYSIYPAGHEPHAPLGKGEAPCALCEAAVAYDAARAKLRNFPAAPTCEVSRVPDIRGTSQTSPSAAVDSCWHCGDVLAPVRPRCERCPDECDIEGCEEPGCVVAPRAL